MGGGKGGSKAPPPIDPGKSMGEYLFGKGFSSQYQGITDPRLQERLIGAERTYRPQYTALELADIGVMARGIEAGASNPEYARLEAELAGLKAGQEVQGARTKEDIENEARKLYPDTKSKRSKFQKGDAITGKQLREAFMKAVGDPGEDRAARIAQIEAQMEGMSPTLEATPGLFDLLEEQSTRAGALQREQLQLQREADVGALQEFAPQVVESYRQADPYSTGLAEQQTAMAEDLYQRSKGLTPEQQRIVDQQALGMAQRQGRVSDQSAVAGQLLGREQYLSGLRSQAAGMGQQAFGMNRQLAGDVGMTLLGRPSAAIGLGGSILGQAQQGAAGPMGPQLFDPNVGINMALQQRGQDVTFQGMQAQADAARGAGIMGGIGGIAQGIGSAGGLAAFCWVAREVYGIDNPKWLEFREWMLNDAPSWLRNMYLKHGPKVAEFISDKPLLKTIIRTWMNGRIK